MIGFYDYEFERATRNNGDFRRVLYTGKHSQLVLMSLKPEEEIGEEVHGNIDQFFRVEEGRGVIIVDGKNCDVTDGSVVIVPAGAKHNVKNTGSSDLKLYTIYSPAEHRDGTVHKTKEEAMEKEEHFDGRTTE